MKIGFSTLVDQTSATADQLSMVFTPDLNTTPVPIDGATNSTYCIAHADGTNNGLY